MAENFVSPKRNPEDFDEAIRLICVRDGKCRSAAISLVMREFPHLRERRASLSGKTADEIEFPDAIKALQQKGSLDFDTAFESARKSFPALYASYLSPNGIFVDPVTHKKIKGGRLTEEKNITHHEKTGGKPFMAQVNEYKAVHKCGVADAMKAIVKADPVAHKAYLESANPGKALIR
jgi:hypothetical protein